MPSLAPFASAALIPDDEGDAANEIESGGGAAEAERTPRHGDSHVPRRVLACRARGGVFVLGVCSPESNAALRCAPRPRRRRRSRRHPTPAAAAAAAAERGGRGRARPGGTSCATRMRPGKFRRGGGVGPRSSPAPPPTSFAEHAVPRARAPRSSSRPPLRRPTKETRRRDRGGEILSAEESEAEGADGGGRGGRPERGPSAERPTPNDQRPNDARRGRSSGSRGSPARGRRTRDRGDAPTRLGEPPR